MIREILPYRPKQPLAPHGHHVAVTCEIALGGEELAGPRGFGAGDDILAALRKTAAGAEASDELARAIDVLIQQGCNVSVREFVHPPLVAKEYGG